jgi:hypothetical protein
MDRMKDDSMTFDTIHPFHAMDDLLDEIAGGPLEGAALARVATLDNEFEAEVIRDALEKNEIPCYIQSFRETAFDGLFIPQRSWGTVITREVEAQTALRIVQEVRSTFGQPLEEGAEGSEEE